MKPIHIYILGLIVLCCKELQTTQKKVNFTVEPSTLAANGNELSTITISFDNLIEEDQEVTIYTTHGSLHETPARSLTTPKTKELIITPSLWGTRDRDQAIVFLRSDNTPSTDVYVSVEINRLFKQEQITFTQELVTNVLVNPSQFELSLSGGQDVTLSIILLSNNGSPSVGGQLSQTITLEDDVGNSLNESVLSIDPLVQITNDTLSTELRISSSSFSDAALTEAFARVIITDVSSAINEELIIKIIP